MKIAIHNGPAFCEHWIKYCQENNIDYKVVDCYSNAIIEDIKDCHALMWHYYHNSDIDNLMAKQLLFAIQQSGKKVFPDFNSNWHFDDKVGQKYLFEAIKAPFVPTFVFFDKNEALNWVENTEYPKVFKLRNGAGSTNVKLVKSKAQAISLVNRAFGKGFSHQRNSLDYLKEKWRIYKLNKSKVGGVKAALKRFFYVPKKERRIGKEHNYIYFQDFIPKNEYDIRVIVIDDKAFAIKRMVRENDFRASGSGIIRYDKENFDNKTIELSFGLAKKLKTQCVAFDFIFSNYITYVVEISYSFKSVGVYEECTGYWDNHLNWYEGPFNPYGWMVNLMLK